MIRLLILDIDGTITQKDQSILPETLMVLRKVSRINEGLKICLASGNVLPVMFGIRNILGVGNSLAGENGGILLHENNIETYFEKSKTVSAYREIEKDLGAREFITNRWRETSVSFILDGKHDYSSYEKKFDVVIQDSGFAKHIMNRGQNKGFIANKIMGLYSIPIEETMACGDGDNDIDLFRAVGTSGTAGNGSKDLKEVAEYISSEDYGSGLIDIMKHFGLL